MAKVVLLNSDDFGVQEAQKTSSLTRLWNQMSDYQPKSPTVSFKKHFGTCEFPKCHKATRQSIQCAKIPRNQASPSHCRANSFEKKFTSICTIWTSTPAWQPGGTTASIIDKHHSTVNSLTTYTFGLLSFASKTGFVFGHFARLARFVEWPVSWFIWHKGRSKSERNSWNPNVTVQTNHWTGFL